MNLDLNALALFVILAEERSFRAAADHIGVTRSAVSQTISKLEATLGIALVTRTTRSVTLTEAGEDLYRRSAPAVADMRAAVEDAGNMASPARGQLRLAVSSIAESFLSGPLLADFAQAHPQVKLHVTVTDEEFDIVAEGYDAGVRLGEVIAQDMIAVPVSGEQRQLPFASPDYLRLHGAPMHPRELVERRCIGWRAGLNVAPYRWEFEENGKAFSVTVDDAITSTDMALMIRLAIAGAGITFGLEESFRLSVARGELVPLLEDFCPRFPGFYLYYPNRHNMAPKLRAFIDHLKR